MIRRWSTRRLLLSALLVSATAIRLRAQDSSLVTLERLFEGNEFWGDFLGPARWMKDGTGYTTFEPAPGGKGRDLVRTDAATGAKQVLLAAAKLVPSGDSVPLGVDNFAFSADGKRVLLYANSRRVWRQNTRGDYWVLDLATGGLRKLGGSAAQPSTLMFAKFSPDGGAGGLRPRAQPLRRASARRQNHPAHQGRFRAPSSTAPSTGSTRRNSTTCATVSAGVPTGSGSPTGSSTPPGCATSC